MRILEERWIPIEVIGLTIVGSPPLGTVHLKIDPGLRVFYGKNGAGKTRLLGAIKDGFQGETTGESVVWIHLRLRLRGDVEREHLMPSGEFLETLERSLSDSLNRELAKSGWFEIPDFVYALDGATAAAGDHDYHGLSFAGLIGAHVWTRALAPLSKIADAVWDEMAASTNLSVRVSTDVPALFFATQPSEQPLLGVLTSLAARIAGARDDWTKRDARDAEPDWVPPLGSEPLPDSIQSEFDGLSGGERFFSEAAYRLSPQLEFLHAARPGWVPVPVQQLTTLRRTEIWNWSGLPRSEPLRLSIETLNALEASDVRIFESDEDVESPTLRIASGAPRILAELADKASSTFEALFLDAPPLDLRLTPVMSWPSGPALEWVALDTSSLEWVSIDDLSEAQRRWAVAAIDNALRSLDPSTSPVIIDEPEQALHSTATAHLGRGLRDLALTNDIPILVASHSTDLIGLSDVVLSHVYRDQSGRTDVQDLTEATRLGVDEAAEELGIAPSGLLQLRRLFLFVEGHHDIAVLEVLFGDLFDSNGVQLLPLGGTRQLATVTDSRFLFTFTDAEILIVLDHVQNDRWSGGWAEAKGLFEAGKAEEASKRLSLLERQADSAEEAQLGSFLRAAVDLGKTHRLHVLGLQRPDIIFYLPADSFVDAGDWSRLGADYQAERKMASGPPEDFKAWLRRKHGSRISTSTIKKAAKRLDHPPDELAGLAARAVSLATSPD